MYKIEGEFRYITITIPYSTKIFYDIEKRNDEYAEKINSVDSDIFNSPDYYSTGGLSTIVDFSGNGKIEASLETESLGDSSKMLSGKGLKYEEDERPIYSQGVLTIKTAKWGTYQFISSGSFYDVNSLSITENTCLPETYWSNIDTSNLIATASTYVNSMDYSLYAIDFSFAISGGDSVIGIKNGGIAGSECAISNFKSATSYQSDYCKYWITQIEVGNSYSYYIQEKLSTENSNSDYYGIEYESPRNNKKYHNFFCTDNNFEEWKDNPQEFQSFFKKKSIESTGGDSANSVTGEEGGSPADADTDLGYESKSNGSCALFNLAFKETEEKLEYDNKRIDFKINYDISIEGDIEVADILSWHSQNQKD